MLQVEFQRVSYDDLMYTTASIFFVFCYITYHCQSIFLGAMGMLQIVLTLPAALFVYRMIFMISFFNQLHILAIYLVLGIGADDIFVFVDAWRQSAALFSHSADRMDYTWRRASKAMLITSSTTIAAFIATATNKIMPISSFAIYASLGIFLNYVFCITLFPTIVMIHHRRLYGCCPMVNLKAFCCCAVGANSFIATDAILRRGHNLDDLDERAAPVLTIKPLQPDAAADGAAPTAVSAPPAADEKGGDADAALPGSVVPTVQAVPEEGGEEMPAAAAKCCGVIPTGCVYSKPFRPAELEVMKSGEAVPAANMDYYYPILALISSGLCVFVMQSSAAATSSARCSQSPGSPPRW